MNETADLLSHADIIQSRFNPRKNFDPKLLGEMVSSMEQHGFDAGLSRLMVRPLPNSPGKYELVIGERRWRAAGVLIAAGKLEAQVPAVVREMTDQQVVELRMIENLQRQDLSPLEEAEGLQYMLEMRDPEAGTVVYTREALAQKLGKTLAHIGHRLSICRLRGTAAGEALEAGEITDTHARLLASVPAGKMRDELTRRVIKPADGIAPIPYRQLEGIIRNEFMVQLRGSEFDQADPMLVPQEVRQVPEGEAGNHLERTKGGACTDCPFNTKNLPEGAPGREGKFAMCLNPECFREKTAKAHEAWMARETKPDKNRRAATAKEAGEIFAINGKSLHFQSGYVDVEDKPDETDLRKGASAPGAWKKILRGANVPIVVAKDGSGKVRELVLRELALKAAQEAEEGRPAAERTFKGKERKEKPAEVDGKHSSAQQGADEERKRQAETARLQAERSDRIARARLAAIHDAARAAGDVPAMFWRLAARTLLDLADGSEGLWMTLERRGWEKLETPEMRKRLGALEHLDALALTVELMVVGVEFLGMDDEEGAYSEWAKAFGVNLKAVTKAVDAEIAAEAAAAAAKKAVVDALQWRTQKEEEEAFGWNGHGVAEQPDVVTLPLPKSSKITVQIEAAKNGLHWYLGYDIQAPKDGHGVPVTLGGSKYDSRELVLSVGLRTALDFLRANKAPATVIKQVEGYVALTTTPTAPVEKKGGKK